MSNIPQLKNARVGNFVIYPIRNSQKSKSADRGNITSELSTDTMCLSTFHDLQTLLNMAFACFSNQFYSTFSHSGLFSGPGIHWPLWICMVSFHSLKYTPPPHTYTHTHTEDPSNSYLSFRFQNFPDLQTSYIPPQYPVLP